jgi:NitT/TauT family transport system permease protein
VLPLTSRPTFSVSLVVEAFVWCVLGAILYGLLARAPATLSQSSPIVSIDLHPSALPGYVALSMGRMTAAYVLSLVFTLVVGYAAAHNRIAGHLVPPALDVLQSIPVLSFLPAVLIGMLALLPGRPGLEIASVVLIFTGMVWNITFSFYHSLLTIPPELTEASRMLQLSPWYRLTRLELPVTVIGVVWNSVMAWAAGWFYLMASESFTLANRSYALPGIGSYLALAASEGNLTAIFTGLGALIAVVVVLDQLIWVPLVLWSRRFKIELAETADGRRSVVQQAFKRSRLLAFVGTRILAPGLARLDQLLGRVSFSRRASSSVLGKSIVAMGLGSLVVIAIGVGRGVVLLGTLVAHLDRHQWLTIGAGTLVTCGRVALALAITFAWTLPVGVAVGERPRLASKIQPLTQIAASVPATALFPILLLVLLHHRGGLEIAAMLLMLLGTQWYVLFNVIAGASALPRDLQEAVHLMRIEGATKWRTFLIPGMFPFLVTGGLTAQGGAFNASVVSEYVTFGGQTFQTVGLGAVVAAAAAGGDYPFLAASTLVMAGVVVALNRVIWRPLAKLAHERYHL